mmetsp:Transcript_12885/g.55335  ORF Transcript_12885/g.55335 Transcript_12885/m.55335 type:complete len:233 (-) Transcript_12885:922-1620(-)
MVPRCALPAVVGHSGSRLRGVEVNHRLVVLLRLKCVLPCLSRVLLLLPCEGVLVLNLCFDVEPVLYALRVNSGFVLLLDRLHLRDFFAHSQFIRDLGLSSHFSRNRVLRQLSLPIGMHLCHELCPRRLSTILLSLALRLIKSLLLRNQPVAFGLVLSVLLKQGGQMGSVYGILLLLALLQLSLPRLLLGLLPHGLLEELPVDRLLAFLDRRELSLTRCFKRLEILADPHVLR